MNGPANEHEKRDGLTEDVYYPDHTQRTESPTFLETKRLGHHANLPCCISGRVDGAEYHHVFIEWAFADAVDWETVKGVALGKITELPVLDLHTDQPTGETYQAIHSLIYTITQLAASRGFDWTAFDPSKPEQFVDSMANMLVLNAKFHRLKDHGIHVMSAPEWAFQAWPRKAGFIFTPDEEKAV
jgi:hypothetical protein